jgi:hypothetical protein
MATFINQLMHQINEKNSDFNDPIRIFNIDIKKSLLNLKEVLLFFNLNLKNVHYLSIIKKNIIMIVFQFKIDSIFK